ncbi:biotin--[acetyl-CoA-carboxylase] ligase [Acidiferrimicrobium sp. IK]|uniref:biotin--[acetyl-CoA-carboxylase] ligase n=1 Tax=Acidiferrimicrobium sp. IK TaxID=2871700 RepID=UPI0021CAEED1|nr:biotin--[acetyl-CoA-carboxylase] ligase [Acidiferrimicrobium sp. IK]MCU4185711.1 biotin--[acetyl-CoA-carboxylase] ligase [Acidiferrimicrobium sp. IK]
MRPAERTRADLAATTRFGDIRYFEEIDSTNRWLREQADAGAADGLVVVADHQTAGRGRLGRTWEAPPGSGLIVSVLHRPAGLPPTRYHLLTAATGIAARDACLDVGGFAPDLKWPNDLLVGDAKLAGILAESVSGAVVVGMGLNLSDAPPGAATADAAAGHPVGRDELLGAFLLRLDRLLGDWDGVAVAYREACATIGRRVRVELSGGVLTGVATAVDDSGCLVVAPDGGGPATVVSAGDVIHLRGAAGPGGAPGQ